MSRKKSTYTDEFKASAVEQYHAAKAAGTTITELANTLGIGAPLLHTWAHKKHVQKRGKNPQPRQTYPIELKQRAVKLVRSGKRIVDAAFEVGVDRRLVNKWVAEGVKRGAARTNLQAPLNSNGISRDVQDVLIYVRHAERAITEMMRDGKLIRLDKAHRLILLAAEFAAEVAVEAAKK